LLCLTTIFPLYNSYKIIHDKALISLYAEKWDKMVLQIEKAKQNHISSQIVPDLPDWAGLEGINSDPKHWVNICASNYFGIQVVTQ